MSSERTIVFTWEPPSHWIVHAPSVPGCHTFGSSIRQATTRMREALSLWVGDAHTTTLVPEFRLPPAIRASVRAAADARRRAEEAHAEAQRALSASAQALTHARLSRRDAAALLGISHQRVQQLLDDC